MSTRSALRCALMCLILPIFAAPALADANIVFKQAPPLPPPTGDVVYVSNVSSLEYQIFTAPPGRTIMVQPGTYYITKTLGPTPGITIRGATGNRDDVVIQGWGMHNTNQKRNIFWITKSDITIADLTIRDAYYHGIQIAAEYQTDRIRLYNVKILDCGERFIKGSTNNNPAYSPDDVVIEYCWLEQTQEFVRRPDNSVDPDNYIGGIDAMWCNRWIIRDCVMKNIRGLTGGGRGGIFLWQNCQDCVIERNAIIGCDTGIALGNPSGPAVGTYHMTNGIMRNNFILRQYDGADNGYVGIELCKTNNTKVYNNTMYSPITNDNDYWRSIHINSSVTTGLRLFNNILRGQIAYTGGAPVATLGTNLIDSAVQPAWFVEPLVGDLRLTAGATAAINAGTVLPEVTNDFLASGRDSQPDIGAHEFVSPVPLQVTAVTPALVQVQHRSAALDTITISFNKDVLIEGVLVNVTGVSTGPHNSFTFSYDSASKTATLQYPAGLPNDAYVVTVNELVSDALTGQLLDGEEDLYSPSLPSGDGTAGGSFSGLIYRLVGDITGDRKVNVFDLQRMAQSWNTQVGQAGYDAVCDLTGDGKVNVFDLQALAVNWNQQIPVGP